MELKYRREHVNTLRIIVEQSNEFKIPIILLFVDFERAIEVGTKCIVP